MSGHACRVPGCTVTLQTQVGIELHERLYHGYNPIGTEERMDLAVDAQSGIHELEVPITQQVSFIQDEIFIQESLDRVSFS